MLGNVEHSSTRSAVILPCGMFYKEVGSGSLATERQLQLAGSEGECFPFNCDKWQDWGQESYVSGMEKQKRDNAIFTIHKEKYL